MVTNRVAKAPFSHHFASASTKAPLDNSAAPPTGQALASFLFGIPTGGNIDVNSSYAQQSRYFAAFVQDDWKIARRLTINLGVRYDKNDAKSGDGSFYVAKDWR